MARLAKSSTVRSDHHSDDDDEFPDLDALVSRKKLQVREDAPTTTTVRRRKLGLLTDNLLLKAWTPGHLKKSTEERHSFEERGATAPRRARVELRTRNTKSVAAIASSPAGQDEEYVSAKEEITLIEEVSILDDTFHSCDSDGSESSEYEDKEDEDFLADFLPKRLTTKPSLRSKDSSRPGRASGDAERRDDFQVKEDQEDKTQRAANPGRSISQTPASKPSARRKETQNPKQAAEELTDALSGLCLDDSEEEPRTEKASRPSNRKVTPPSTPPKSRPGLISPKKLARIPNTPHRSTSDLFWSQEFVDDWNDEHSPRKQLFPDAAAAKQRSPSKIASPEKKPQKTAAAGQQTSEREAKKAFEKAKHELAEKFLHELDTTITDGKLAELSASTGGIKLIWTNKLNTTAGRANWKRETIRTTAPSTNTTTTTTTTTTTKHKHHASIELAEKVIDSPPRLLNVLAHEFCHLANFMISNVTTNPHGREFKAWAARCTRAFGDRGIEVTTKHSYDIAFKYVWECVACGTEFKRHSRSIDPARHRCGSCREELRQTKPVPRRKKGDGGEGGVSGYQAFVKAQMRVVKEENPKSPQKEIMKIVAGRWAAQKAKGQAMAPDEEVQEVVEGLEDLAL